MPIADSIPVISQIKSLFQAIFSDPEGALRTQENFVFENTFPVISQIVSAAYAIGGELDKARELQHKFVKDAATVTDSLPGLGHVKGVVHYSMGDNDAGDASMKAATRAVGVAVGVTGMIACGPVCAAGGGIAGGAALDGVITAGELLVHGRKAEPHGYAKSVVKIVETLEGNDTMSSDDIIDMATLPVLDGVNGYLRSSTGPGETFLRAAKMSNP
jgi:hypothetical protein